MKKSVTKKYPKFVISLNNIDGTDRARFTTIINNMFDCWYRQAAFNISRGLKILGVATV